MAHVQKAPEAPCLIAAMVRAPQGMWVSQSQSQSQTSRRAAPFGSTAGLSGTRLQWQFQSPLGAVFSPVPKTGSVIVPLQSEDRPLTDRSQGHDAAGRLNGQTSGHVVPGRAHVAAPARSDEAAVTGRRMLAPSPRTSLLPQDLPANMSSPGRRQFPAMTQRNPNPMELPASGRSQRRMHREESPPPEVIWEPSKRTRSPRCSWDSSFERESRASSVDAPHRRSSGVWQNFGESQATSGQPRSLSQQRSPGVRGAMGLESSMEQEKPQGRRHVAAEAVVASETLACGLTRTPAEECVKRALGTKQKGRQVRSSEARAPWEVEEIQRSRPERAVAELPFGTDRDVPSRGNSPLARDKGFRTQVLMPYGTDRDVPQRSPQMLPRPHVEALPPYGIDKDPNLRSPPTPRRLSSSPRCPLGAEVLVAPYGTDKDMPLPSPPIPRRLTSPRGSIGAEVLLAPYGTERDTPLPSPPAPRRLTSPRGSFGAEARPELNVELLADAEVNRVIELAGKTDRQARLSVASDTKDLQKRLPEREWWPQVPRQTGASAERSAMPATPTSTGIGSPLFPSTRSRAPAITGQPLSARGSRDSHLRLRVAPPPPSRGGAPHVTDVSLARSNATPSIKGHLDEAFQRHHNVLQAEQKRIETKSASVEQEILRLTQVNESLVDTTS